jgi:hypothetical protein
MEALAWVVGASLVAVIVAVVVLARKRAVPPPVDGQRRTDLTRDRHDRA